MSGLQDPVLRPDEGYLPGDAKNQARAHADLVDMADSKPDKFEVGEETTRKLYEAHRQSMIAKNPRYASVPEWGPLESERSSVTKAAKEAHKAKIAAGQAPVGSHPTKGAEFAPYLDRAGKHAWANSHAGQLSIRNHVSEMFRENPPSARATAPTPQSRSTTILNEGGNPSNTWYSNINKVTDGADRYHADMHKQLMSMMDASQDVAMRSPAQGEEIDAQIRTGLSHLASSAQAHAKGNYHEAAMHLSNAVMSHNMAGMTLHRITNGNSSAMQEMAKASGIVHGYQQKYGV